MHISAIETILHDSFPHSVHVLVHTDEGVTGRCGPFRAPCAWFVANQLRPILVGEDPLASEYLWDMMHRLLVHGRQGEAGGGRPHWFSKLFLNRSANAEREAIGPWS